MLHLQSMGEQWLVLVIQDFEARLPAKPPFGLTAPQSL